MGISNVRYSVRSFARTPLSTVALVLTIGLGVGANAAVDGFIRGLSAVTAANETTPEMAIGLAQISALLRAVATAVFVIACANVASLLLSRASARSHETSVRVALGVSRAQLTRQLLADSMVVAVAGGAMGGLLTAWTTMLVPVLSFEEDAEQLVFAPDAASILFIIAIGILLTMASGTLPLLELRHDQPSRVLEKENAGSSARMRALRTSLVMMQLALCCVLIVSMAVLVQGLDAALETRATHRLGRPIIVTTQAQLFDSPFETANVGLDYFQRIEKAARAAGPIFDAAWVWRPPGSRPFLQPVRIELPDLATREVTLDVVPLTSELLRNIRMPPVRGRMFGRGDTERCAVAVVNEQAADALFGGDPSGGESRIPRGSTSRSSASSRRCPRASTDRPAKNLLRCRYARDSVPADGAIDVSGSDTVRGLRSPDRTEPRVGQLLRRNEPAAGNGPHSVRGRRAWRVPRWRDQPGRGGPVLWKPRTRWRSDRRRWPPYCICRRRLDATARATQQEAEPTMFTSMTQDFAPRHDDAAGHANSHR